MNTIEVPKGQGSIPSWVILMGIVEDFKTFAWVKQNYEKIPPEWWYILQHLS